MRSRPGLLAAACLVVGGLAVATLPATPAVASGQVCEGIVLDDGNGSAAAVQAGQVAPGASDLEALSAAGDTVAQNDSGLVCAIDNYPANGLANCTATSGGDYYYWSYWSGDPYTNTWTYAEIGPSEHTVTDGQTYVQGWRYQDPGPSGPSATKPSVTPAAAFAQACPGVTPVAPSSGGGGSGSGGGGSGSGGSTPTTTAPTPTTTQTTRPPHRGRRRRRPPLVRTPPAERRPRRGRPAGRHHRAQRPRPPRRRPPPRSEATHGLRQGRRRPSWRPLMPPPRATRGATRRCPSSSWPSSSHCSAAPPGSAGAAGRERNERRSAAPPGAPAGLVGLGRLPGRGRHADDRSQPVPLVADRRRRLLRRRQLPGQRALVEILEPVPAHRSRRHRHPGGH